VSKDFAISVRDHLSDMAKEVLDQGGDEIEKEVCSCCISMAVEALEEWIYGGKWTPSVMPVKIKREWFKMPPDKADDEEWEGPPWDRQPKKPLTVEEKFPTLAKMKAKREKDNKKGLVDDSSGEVDLDTRKIEDWSEYEKRMLRGGDRSDLIRAVVSTTKCSVKDAKAYIDRLVEEGELEAI